MRLAFISILGEPGTYDGTVYEGIPGGDDECRWFRRTFSYLDGVEILGYRVSHGDPVPTADSADAFILGGSYNSVHDDFLWQRELLAWFEVLRAAEKPFLGICGGHQLLSYFHGSHVAKVPDPPVAGSLSVSLTQAGRRSPLFAGIDDEPEFHFANYEHVVEAPTGATVLATRAFMPVTALDHGGRWYSVQFHPEADVETISAGWRPTHPQLMSRYKDCEQGKRMIENFLTLART